MCIDDVRLNLSLSSGFIFCFLLLAAIRTQGLYSYLWLTFKILRISKETVMCQPVNSLVNIEKSFKKKEESARRLI